MKPRFQRLITIRVSFAAFLFVVGLQFQSAVWAEVSLSSLTQFLSPGELTQSHAEDEKLKDCYACHTLTRGIDDSLCLDCHKAIKERLSNKNGYHGTLQGSCAECHTDHKGLDTDITGLNSEAFNHRQANYPLTGKHAEIKCDKCHSKKESRDKIQNLYINIKFGECTDCHKDPHPKGFGPDCAKCHTTTGWSERALTYSHSLDSKYRLLGKHQELNCDKCHRNPDDPDAKFVLPATECAQCHQDIHKEQLSQQCEKCHNERGWTKRNLNYSHAQDSKYKLLGKHQELGCEKCHKPNEPEAKLGFAQFKNLGTECLQCHEDEHKEQLSKQCQECHNEFGWKGAFVTFNHKEQSEYKLDAAHESVACADCHEDKKYKPLKSECVDCHGEYDSIMAGNPTEATASAKADPHWKRVRCDQCHETRLENQGIALYQDKCVECHNQRYGPLLLDWMKDRSKYRLEIQALLQQAQEDAVLSEDKLEQISQRLTKIDKIGSHNFHLAPIEWKALKAELEREIGDGLRQDPKIKESET
jgi:hypothetical protein